MLYIHVLVHSPKLKCFKLSFVVIFNIRDELGIGCIGCGVSLYSGSGDGICSRELMVVVEVVMVWKVVLFMHSWEGGGRVVEIVLAVNI